MYSYLSIQNQQWKPQNKKLVSLSLDIFLGPKGLPNAVVEPQARSRSDWRDLCPNRAKIVTKGAVGSNYLLGTCGPSARSLLFLSPFLNILLFKILEFLLMIPKEFPRRLPLSSQTTTISSKMSSKKTVWAISVWWLQIIAGYVSLASKSVSPNWRGGSKESPQWISQFATWGRQQGYQK